MLVAKWESLLEHGLQSPRLRTPCFADCQLNVLSVKLVMTTTAEAGVSTLRLILLTKMLPLRSRSSVQGSLGFPEHVVVEA